MRSGWLRASIYRVLLVLGSALLFQNHYPRFTGAPSCRFRTLTRRPPSVDSGLGPAYNFTEPRVVYGMPRGETTGPRQGTVAPCTNGVGRLRASFKSHPKRLEPPVRIAVPRITEPPNHISKTVPPTIHLGPPDEARTPREGGGLEDHRAPSHISKTVLSTMHLCGGVQAEPNEANGGQRRLGIYDTVENLRQLRV